MVRSLENLPDLATFKMALRTHVTRDEAVDRISPNVVNSIRIVKSSVAFALKYLPVEGPNN
jgi:hypothetical protein